MKNLYNIFLSVVILIMALGCSRKNEDLVLPVSLEDYPQVVLFDDEEGGELEDSDEFSITILLADRFDPTGENLSGKIVGLNEDFLLEFEVINIEGIAELSSFILGVEAYYETDECTTSLDIDVDILESYDPISGIGRVRFPQGVEEITLDFELDEDYLNDDLLNDERKFEIALASVNNVPGISIFDQTFEYTVLDDEAIFGEYEFDFSDPAAFSAFKALFGLINDDVASLSADEIDEIIWGFEFDEMKIEIVLKQSEEIEDCGEIEIENIVIEIEAGYEELTIDALEGEIEVEGSVELEDRTEEDFVYSGSFSINGKILEISLSGEFDGEETDVITLFLEK